MAILKMIDPPIHSGGGKGAYAHLKRAISYAQDPDKTKGYIGNANCAENHALEEMTHTKKHYGKEPHNRRDRVGYHFVISWSPEENVPPEVALEVTKEFCEKCLPQYEVAYGVHLDQEHVHSHLVFNSVNFETGKMFRYEKNDWELVYQPILDEICKKHGLHTLETDTGIPLGEYKNFREGRGRTCRGTEELPVHPNHKYENEKKQEYSYSDYLRADIDELIVQCETFEDFEKGIYEKGYQVKYGTSEQYGEYMAVRGKGMRRFRRTQTLGRDYTLSMIKGRIAAYHTPLQMEEMQDENQYLIPGKLYRCGRFRKIDNVYLRKQYARLYRLGVISKNTKRLSYKETKERLLELRKLEQQLDLIAEKGYRNTQDMETDLQQQEEVIKNIQDDIKMARTEAKPYLWMLDCYEKKEELEAAFQMFQEGDVNFEKEGEEYQRLEKLTEGFPFSKEELELYKKQHIIRLRKLNRKFREEKKKEASILELKEQYGDVMAEYEPAEDKTIDEMEQQREPEQRREKERKNR